MSDLTRRLMYAAVALVALGFAGCCAGAAGISSGWYHPAPVEEIAANCSSEAPLLPRGKELRILVWNAQFSAGRKQNFFYDGGRAVSVPGEDVRATLDGMAAVVKRLDPDIVIWQELDVDSARTGRVDEIRALLEQTPYACTVEAPYHKAAYVPHPPHEHMGKVDMRLSIWSKYRIAEGTRIDLPRLDESWIRQQFNLKRALLVADFPIEGGGTFRAFDSHLSAFSRGDGTLPSQLARIAEELDAASDAGLPWVLGADLNSLPPGVDPSQLSVGADLYEPESPLTGWYDRYTPAVPLSELHRDPDPFYTWMPFGSTTPDRTIDHVFHGEGVAMHGFSVVRDAAELSDHLPLIFDFALD